MVNRMTVQEAARVLGVSPQFVRRGLQQGRLPIGAAVKGKSRWSYHISTHLLMQYTGKGGTHDDH